MVVKGTNVDTRFVHRVQTRRVSSFHLRLWIPYPLGVSATTKRDFCLSIYLLFVTASKTLMPIAPSLGDFCQELRDWWTLRFQSAVMLTNPARLITLYLKAISVTSVDHFRFSNRNLLPHNAWFSHTTNAAPMPSRVIKRI